MCIDSLVQPLSAAAPQNDVVSPVHVRGRTNGNQDRGKRCGHCLCRAVARRRSSRSNGMSESATRSQRQSGGFSVPSATGVRIGNIVFIGVLQCARSCATIDFVDRGNAEGAVNAINKSVGGDVFNRPDRHRICAQIAQRHAADQCAVGEFEPATATSRRRWRGQVATGDAQQHSRTPRCRARVLSSPSERPLGSRS